MRQIDVNTMLAALKEQRNSVTDQLATVQAALFEAEGELATLKAKLVAIEKAWQEFKGGPEELSDVWKGRVSDFEGAAGIMPPVSGS